MLNVDEVEHQTEAVVVEAKLAIRFVVSGVVDRIT